MIDSARRPDVPAERMDPRVLNDGSRHEVFKRWFEPAQLADELGGGAIVHAGAWFVAVPCWLRRMEQRRRRCSRPGPAGRRGAAGSTRATWRTGCSPMGARREAGVYNAVAPPGWTTWGALLEACRDAVNPDADAALGRRRARRGSAGGAVGAAADLAGAAARASRTSTTSTRRRAEAAGLRIRPLAETVGDTWSWLRDGGELSEWRDEVRGEALDAARERALLEELMS